MKKILILGLLSIGLYAGPVAVVAKAVTQIADTAGAVANSYLGGVQSKKGSVEAEANIEGDAINVASGKKAIAKLRVGSNRGVTAENNIKAKAHVKGNVINVSSGEGSTADMALGSNGN